VKPIRPVHNRWLAPGLALLALLACSNSGGGGSGTTVLARASRDSLLDPEPVPDSAQVPVVPILSRYEVHQTFELESPSGGRADYSGVTVAAEDTAAVTLWLADDKPTRAEQAIFEIHFPVSGNPRSDITKLVPAAVPIRNEHGVPTGDDIEDLAWLPPEGNLPGLLALVGERGPGDAPQSWMYLMIRDREGFLLSRSGRASPPGESVGNDGMEGLALRRRDRGVTELYLFKERPAPVYARIFRLTADSLGYTVGNEPDTLHAMSTFQTQAGAAFTRSGDRLYVIDRQQRRIAVIWPLAQGTGLESRPRQWLDYTAIDSLLEGRDAETPPSLFGVAEGIAEDSKGRLYLLADNNEVRNSRLVVLRRKSR
jgi:hypothetical protein